MFASSPMQVFFCIRDIFSVDGAPGYFRMNFYSLSPEIIPPAPFVPNRGGQCPSHTICFGDLVPDREDEKAKKLSDAFDLVRSP